MFSQKVKDFIAVMPYKTDEQRGILLTDFAEAIAKKAGMYTDEHLTLEFARIKSDALARGFDENWVLRSTMALIEAIKPQQVALPKPEEVAPPTREALEKCAIAFAALLVPVKEGHEAEFAAVKAFNREVILELLTGKKERNMVAWKHLQPLTDKVTWKDIRNHWETAYGATCAHLLYPFPLTVLIDNVIKPPPKPIEDLKMQLESKRKKYEFCKLFISSAKQRHTELFEAFEKGGLPEAKALTKHLSQEIEALAIIKGFMTLEGEVVTAISKGEK